MALQWTTNRQFTAPAAAAGVSVTPSGTAFVSSAWVQITGFTDAAWVLTGIVPTPGALVNSFFVDIGVGSAGSEDPICTLPGGFTDALSAYGPTDMGFTYSIDKIPFGSRVSVRLRISTTDVTPWTFAITYFRKPLTGVLETTTQPTKCVPNDAVDAVMVSGATSWLYGAYTELMASAPADLLITAFKTRRSINGQDYEIQIATGAAASETPIGFIRGQNGLADGPHYTRLPNPMAGISAGQRVSARWRTAENTTRNGNLALTYVELPL